MASDSVLSERGSRLAALRSPRWWSVWLFILLVGILVAAMPMPFMIFSSQPPRAIGTMIEIEGAPRALSGTLLASSVGYRQGTPALAVWAWVDPSRAIVPLPEDLEDAREGPHGVRSYRESVLAAATVGLQLAGRDVAVTSDGLAVTEVTPDSPAANWLRTDDLLLEAEGQELVFPGDLQAVTSSTAPGETVTILLQRDGEERTVEVGVQPLGAGQRTVIGVTTTARRPTVAFPDGIRISAIETDAEGGSAGLLLALAVYDRFAAEPLLPDAAVTGTGAIDLEGGVHPIDGIVQKVRAAAAADLDVFLAPSAQYEEAVDAAGDDIRVMSVSTISGAIETLRALQDDGRG